MKKTPKIYRVLFRQGEEIYEVHARNVYHGNMPGFVEIEDILYGKRTTLIDPADEKVRSQFKSVERTYIPHFNIIRIDELDKEGENKVLRDKESVVFYSEHPTKKDKK